MAKENEILNKLDGLKSNEQFKVPDGYFNSLPNKIIDRIKEEEKIEIPTQRKRIFYLVRNQLAIAASFAALFLLSYTVIRHTISRIDNNSLTEKEIFASLESEIHDIDETYLYSLAFNEKQLKEQESNTLTEEEITEYLLDNATEIDLSNNDF